MQIPFAIAQICTLDDAVDADAEADADANADAVLASVLMHLRKSAKNRQTKVRSSLFDIDFAYIFVLFPIFV